MDENRTVNIGIQVLPLSEDALPQVEQAIRAIIASGLRYEVGPLETVIEGPFEDAWAAAKAAHLAAVAGGSVHVITILKIADAPGGTLTMDDKTGKWRR